MNTIKSFYKHCTTCWEEMVEQRMYPNEIKDVLEELEVSGCYRDCPRCGERFIDENASAVDKMRTDFNEGIPFGTQLEVLDSNRLAADEFGREPEERLDSEFESNLNEMEAKFDEWWSKNENSPRVKWEIGEQCKNFLVAIRKRYMNVALVKMATEKMNPRERTLVWGTWKGWSHKVYYPKG